MREGSAWNKREIERRIGMRERKRRRPVHRPTEDRTRPRHLHIVRVITSKKFPTMVQEYPTTTREKRGENGKWRRGYVDRVKNERNILTENSECLFRLRNLLQGRGVATVIPFRSNDRERERERNRSYISNSRRDLI